MKYIIRETTVSGFAYDMDIFIAAIFPGFWWYQFVTQIQSVKPNNCFHKCLNVY